MLRVFSSVLFLVLGTLPFLAQAETRVAFVVGNSAYEHSPALLNPGNDAQLLAATLRDLNFEVELLLDQPREQLGRALSGFLKTHSGADVALFYFAGHGMQFDGENYLLPVDAKLSSEFDIAGETISLNRVTELMRKSAKANLVFIDACRNNPLAETFYRENFTETRALMSRGLAPVTSPSDGTMMVFSASPGQLAYDGEGENSVFAASLAKHLPTENAEILSLMKRVIGDVKFGTGNRQSPIVTNDLVTEIYLKLGDGGAAAALTLKQEEIFFDAAQSVGTRRAWTIFLNKYPDGNFAPLAYAELERLGAVDLAQASGTRVTADNTVEVRRDVATSAETALGLTVKENTEVQQALLNRGYDAGPADGVVGQRTRRAVADFQAFLNLPSTGVITETTAKALGVEVIKPETSDRDIIASRNAKRYDPAQLAIIETDPRLIAATKAMGNKEFVYGFYDDRLYVAVQTWQLMSLEQAQSFARDAGGYLATIADSAENAFIYDMVKYDQRFWHKHTRGHSTTFGPSIGLYQLDGALEPAGGWTWVTGEPVTFMNWSPGEPSNSSNTEMFASYIWDIFPRNSARLHGTAPRWGDLPHSPKSLVIEIE